MFIRNLLFAFTKDINERDNDSFSFADRETKGYVRINNKGFVRIIKAYCPEYDFSQAKKFLGMMNEEKGIFIVDLNKSIDGDQIENE